MTQEDLDALAEILGDAVREQITAVKSEMRSEFEQRIAAIPAGPAGPAGRDGMDGKDGRAGADGQPGRDGVDGRNGTDGKDGVNGRDGKDSVQGPAGERGERGEKGEPGEQGIRGLQGERGEKGDLGEPGRPGDTGNTGPQGERGATGDVGPKGMDGKDGEPGRDGKSTDPLELQRMIDDSMERRVNQWALDFERHAQDRFQRAIDKMPLPKDGQDAFGLEDFELKHDDHGRFTFLFKRGELEKSFTYRVPCFEYRGVFTPDPQDGPYLRGHAVTFGGSVWICLQDETPEKPGTGVGWQLAVKKGDRGKDGDQKPRTDGPVKL